MTTRATAYDAIRGRWKTLVADALSIATVYDNQDAEPPQTGAWARCLISDVSGETVAIGGGATARIFRRHGLLTGRLFYPYGTGTDDANDSAQTVLDSFRGVTVSGVEFFEAYAATVGPDIGSGGRWWQINVLARFWYDDTN